MALPLYSSNLPFSEARIRDISSSISFRAFCLSQVQCFGLQVFWSSLKGYFMQGEVCRQSIHPRKIHLFAIPRISDPPCNLLNVFSFPDFIGFALWQIETRNLRLETVKFGLRKEIEQTLTLLAVNARTKGIHVSCTIDVSVPKDLIGDPMRLRQIFLNLASNSLKFTGR
jgi:hypothetical protein